MPLPSQLMEVQYAAESSFAENAESASSNTWDTSIPVLGPPVVSIPQERVRDASLRARSNVEEKSHPGARTAELEFTTYFPGHGGTAATSLTQTWAQDLLSDGLGGGTVAGVGTTISGTGSTATSVNVTSSSDIAAGEIVRIGTKGDGKGDGQAVVVGTSAGNVLTLLTAAPAAPTTNAHVVYATQLAYHDESTLTSLATKRFLVMHSTTGAQYHLMGGQLAGLRFQFVPGDMPRITWRYRFAYWQRASTTFPSSTAVQRADCAPMAGGSMFINAVGTATRATINPARVDFSVDLGLEPVIGVGGNGTYQFITGWVRTMAKPSLSVDIPWESTYETWWDTANGSLTNKHILLTCNPTDGRSVGLYMPSVFPVGQRPSGVTPVNNQNYVTVNFQGTEGPTTTNEKTRSAFRLFMG